MLAQSPLYVLIQQERRGNRNSSRQEATVYGKRGRHRPCRRKKVEQPDVLRTPTKVVLYPKVTCLAAVPRRWSAQIRVPRLVCVSHETAPNRSRSSSSVSAINSSGTGRPSLNRRGRRISNRRKTLLIGGAPLNRECHTFPGQSRKRRFRHQRVSVRVGLERKTTCEKTKRLAFGFGVGKTNFDHA